MSRLLHRALLAVWWSLPLGLAEAVRVASLGVRYSTLYGGMQALAGACAVVLFYAVVFFFIVLAAGFTGRVARRGRPDRWQEVAVLGCLMAGAVLQLDPGRLGKVAALSLVLATWAATATGLVIWRRTARTGRSFLFAGAVLLYALPPWVQDALAGPAAVGVLAGAALVAAVLHAVLWPPRAGHVAALLSVAATLVVLGALAPGPRSPSGPSTGPILLITVDTLRADARGPNLERLARAGVVFRRAYAPSPWTMPSIYSMLTSRHPHEIGMTHHQSLSLPEGVARLPDYLPQDVELRAVVTNLFGDRRLGTWPGFDAIESADLTSVSDAVLRGLILPRLLLGVRPLRYPFTEARAADVTARAVRHLDAATAGRLVLWVHYYDPHTPYDPPEPHDSGVGPERPAMAGVRGRTLRGLVEGKSLDDEDRAYARALYDGEVGYTDAMLGRLLDALEARGLWDDALILFASDHGEEFWEHGGVEHGHTLYDELVRIPLIIKLPGGAHAGTQSDAPAGLLDVLPTVLDALDEPVPPGSPLRGRSLLPAAAGEPAEPRPLYLEALISGTELKGVVDWPWKLILEPRAGVTRLYHLEEDPAETVDRAAEEPDRVRALLDVIRPHLEAEAESVPSAADPELMRRLRALGYVQ